MRFSKGFTLVEMVVSLTILSVITLGLMNFGVSSSVLYVESKHRLEALEEARFVLARFERELANTMPLSPRVLNDGRCMEYIPLLSVTEYNPDSFDLNIDNFSTAVELASPLPNEVLQACQTQTCRASIHPSSTRALYLDPDVDEQTYDIDPSFISAQSLVLNDPIFSRPISATNRLFIYLPNAAQMCVEDTQIRYYPQYSLDFQGLGLSNPETSHTFAVGVQEQNNIFDIGVDANYSNIASIHFELAINNGAETVEFMQNAQILNSQ
ncbi:prepilin-type N-terminal cleavage/methylation domain-containing protein [Vibrio sp. RE86]|uniref:PilW family protein n=1 Tax=Vibrio sp. RE86 TaxID=2607605 RepID=UPI0014939B5B|nr:prepilin-type N-terminal cleavage/methylation domain-containing protein [Vibrio sp. RE86]NOH79155.1 prepilin-type N-terminal cleavage/methylation domain-containing protein [Vibrio sp. RE86]